MQQKKRFELTSFALHILAMALMLCDHLWATVVPGNDWLTCVGRIAFPIFAFMIVEGYHHTGDRKKYVLRLLVFALLSEIPFNLVMGGGIFYPFHQNVLWTFLLGLAMIRLNEKAMMRKMAVRILVGAATIVLGYILGLLTMVDYNKAGVLTVMMFWFLRGRKWWNYVGQFICLAYINAELLKGLSFAVVLFGNEILVSQQALAVLALIPIWLYRGKQGYYNKTLKYIYYAFYPVHLLILGLIVHFI